MPPRRKLLVAIVVGVLLAGSPVAAFNFWLTSFVERQGREELEHSARRSVALAESRIVRATKALDELASRGIDSCRPAHVEALRQATFATTPVKEFSVIAVDGRTLCSDLGGPPEQRKVISSERATAGSEVLLEVVRLGDRPGQLVRVRRLGNGAANGLAAMIPAELFLAQVSARGGPLDTHARMTTRGGTVITEAGVVPETAAGPDDVLVGTLQGTQYALSVTISLPRSSVAERQGDLRTLGTITTGLLAILVLTLSLLLPKKPLDNPIEEIERALKAGEFVPYYQPIVDIRSGRLRGAEVLVRWRKPDGTIIPPATFIPLAESSGLIIELTRALMRRVCVEAGPTFGLRPHLKVSFNLTARHFTSEEVCTTCARSSASRRSGCRN